MFRALPLLLVVGLPALSLNGCAEDAQLSEVIGCGNGVLESGEECDDGPGNGEGRGCSTSCRRVEIPDGGVTDLVDGGFVPTTTVTFDCPSCDRISAGYLHTCGIKRDGTLACWGDDDWGQSSPPPGRFVAVAAGFRYTCALDLDRRPVCFGDSQGQGSIDAQTPDGSCVSGFCQEGAHHGEACGSDEDCAVGPLMGIGASIAHTCGLDEAGELRCWKKGNDCFGLLPCDSSGKYRQLSVKRFHVCGVREDASVHCWGTGQTVEPNCSNNGHECGQAIPPVGQFIQVSVGFFHTCALAADHSVRCFGTGANGTSEEWQNYGQANPPPGKLVLLAAGGYFTCGLSPSREIVCWGRNAGGILDAIPSGPFDGLVCGEGHCCAVRDEGEVLCWGEDHVGQATVPADFP